MSWLWLPREAMLAKKSDLRSIKSSYINIIGGSLALALEVYPCIYKESRLAFGPPD